MSWLDNVENTIFTIRTGDGKLYTPDLPINYETIKEFNAATFEFIDQPGALITRKLVRARKFELVFFFQGAQNIEFADAFDTSANDPRAWVVRHPQYGDITGQPISIRRNDSKLNATEITVDFWETITTSFPVAFITTADQVIRLQAIFHFISPINYASKVDLKPADVNILTTFRQDITAIVKKGMDAVHYTEFVTDVNQMTNTVNNLILAPVDAISAIHDVILLPSKLILSVTLRIEMIGAIYTSVAQLLSVLPSANNKAFFETAAGISICSLAQAITTPLASDYITRDQVNAAANNLYDMYQDYLATLDAAYLPIGDINSAFSASQETQTALQDVVLQALYNLNTVAFGAKVERLVLLEQDAQLIVLTHKYMGLDAADANIETFRTINNLKNNNVFLVPRGTQIKYYV